MLGLHSVFQNELHSQQSYYTPLHKAILHLLCAAERRIENGAAKEGVIASSGNPVRRQQIYCVTGAHNRRGNKYARPEIRIDDKYYVMR